MISLGVDVGGTGCKCVAFTDCGTQIALSYAEYPLASGGVNLSPETLSASIFQVIRDCRSLLYDVRRGCWSDELVEASGICRAQLPEVVPTGTSLGTILPEMAARLGLPSAVQVVPGTHDQIVNALGAGVRQSGDANPQAKYTENVNGGSHSWNPPFFTGCFFTAPRCCDSI